MRFLGGAESKFVYFSGAGSRTRTDTVLPLPDFESGASTNFAIPASKGISALYHICMKVSRVCLHFIVLFQNAYNGSNFKQIFVTYMNRLPQIYSKFASITYIL